MSIIDELDGKLVNFDGTGFFPLISNMKYNFAQLLENDIVSNKNFPITKLVGILHLSSSHIITTDKKGMIKKPFTSFFKKFKDIQVKTSKTTILPDEYVVIRIEINNDNNIEYAVDEYLGKVGDQNAEFKFLLAIGTSHWTKKHDKYFEKLATIDLTPNRIDLTHIDIYSVDPIGCEDIDDAIHIIPTQNGWEVGIHISDVSSCISEDSIFDIELSKRVESIYPPYESSKQINMIPNSLSIKHLSLKEGLQKKAFSIIFSLDKNYIISDIKFIKTLIIVKRNLSYEECELLYKNNSSLKLMFDIGLELKKKIYNSFSIESVYDCHQMVEVYMIYANMLVAEKIASVNSKNVLLRSQQSFKKKYIDSTNFQTNNPDILKRCKLSLCDRAFYKNGTDNSSHIGLHLDLYTHFTSPMRRYFDIMVHRQLWRAINNIHISKTSTKTLFILNTYKKIYNQLNRYWININIISNALFENGAIQEHVGYITAINDEFCSVKIYIPKLGIESTSTVINQKFLKTVSQICEINKVTYINNETQKKISLNISQEVKISTIFLKKSMEKIQIDIIDPNITDFLFYT